jgi:xanthine/uracil permease
MDEDGTFVAAVAGLTAGLLPILAPSLYASFPQAARLVLSSGVTMSALVGVAVSALFLVRRTTALPPGE